MTDDYAEKYLISGVMLKEDGLYYEAFEMREIYWKQVRAVKDGMGAILTQRERVYFYKFDVVCDNCRSINVYYAPSGKPALKAVKCGHCHCSTDTKRI